MSEENRPIETIFNAAKALPNADERHAYLDMACRHDQSLRREVELLLSATGEADGFFAGRPAGLTNVDRTVVEAAVVEGPGTVIGRYTLLQKIGEGGFGIVYMAEQKEPVRRRVALKIIKLGMDTAQVVARFEAERQALAMMEHPNIAKILDGGVTEGRLTSRPELGDRDVAAPGRPFFVMELVKGQSITAYCDEHKLPTRQRLELFIPMQVSVLTIDTLLRTM